MGHVRTPEADSDLDEIWYYVARSSGSAGIADRLIDAITERFHLLAQYPKLTQENHEAPGQAIVRLAM